MPEQKNCTLKTNSRESERGAALISVLLISLLLLVAVTALLMTTSSFTANVTDTVAEQQAYFAAESGLQSVLNVLRGNVAPSPTFGSVALDKINYTKALQLSTSNLSTDNSAFPRLSRWLNYDYTPPGSLIADRVTLKGTANPPTSYSPISGYAFSVDLTDVDNVGLVSFTTTGEIRDTNGNSDNWIVLSGAGGSAKIEFVGVTQTNVSVLPNPANISFGKFKITTSGSGATLSQDLRFSIRAVSTAPFNVSMQMRGYIRAGVLTSSSVTAFVEFDAKNYILQGSKIQLNSKIFPLQPPSGETNILGTYNAAEPLRLLVRSRGYGPMGSSKQLQMIVRKNSMGAPNAPSAITLVGPPTNPTNNNFVFSAGNSSSVVYSGDDFCYGDNTVPAFGVTNNPNLVTARNEISSNVNLIPLDPRAAIQDVSQELPDWLKSPQATDEMIKALREIAINSGRYFPVGTVPNTIGDNTSYSGVTFIEGDAELSQAGGGILVVTGRLTFKGGFNFKGIVIVTGTEGIRRNGGGSALIEGNLIAAPYNPNNLSAGYYAPKYEISGGGSSVVKYNSCAYEGGLNSISNVVVGVAEK